MLFSKAQADSIMKMGHTVIIGGGPAGAIAAELIARGGGRVTVLEEKVGWEKPCGGGVTHKALLRYPFLLPATAEAKPVQERVSGWQ